MPNPDKSARLTKLVCILFILLAASLVLLLVLLDRYKQTIFQGPGSAGVQDSETACLLKPYDKLITRSKSSANNDSTTLVNIEAFLRIEREDSYLPLTLERVSQSRGTNDEEIMLLMMDCARLRFHLVGTTRELLVTEIEVETVFTKEKQTAHRSLECSIQGTPIRLLQQMENYYSCMSQIELPCLERIWSHNMDSFSTKRVAQLTLKQIEFERDGKRSSISRGIFSKKRQTCVFNPAD